MDNRFLKMLDELKKEPLDLNLNSRVLIVDGLNQFIRTFATSPVTNDDGLHVGGITGFFLTIGYAIKHLKPTRVILVFDGRGDHIAVGKFIQNIRIIESRGLISKEVRIYKLMKILKQVWLGK